MEKRNGNAQSVRDIIGSQLSLMLKSNRTLAVPLYLLRFHRQ